MVGGLFGEEMNKLKKLLRKITWLRKLGEWMVRLDKKITGNKHDMHNRM